ncbi:MAG: RHS repeat-associated core domain-containing protein, partial [Deltaproteobacteria bacterium]
YPNGARENLWTNDALVPIEPMGFTTKEADEEIGVTYFGERWLIPRLGRWATPDPLHIHASGGGEALNSYHYVSGNLLQAVDPLGLTCEGSGCGGTGAWSDAETGYYGYSDPGTGTYTFNLYEEEATASSGGDDSGLGEADSGPPSRAPREEAGRPAITASDLLDEDSTGGARDLVPPSLLDPYRRETQYQGGGADALRVQAQRVRERADQAYQHVYFWTSMGAEVASELLGAVSEAPDILEAVRTVRAMGSAVSRARRVARAVRASPVEVPSQVPAPSVGAAHVDSAVTDLRNPESRPAWGHTFSEHGMSRRDGRTSLASRARSTRDPQGRWLRPDAEVIDFLIEASPIPLHNLENGRAYWVNLPPGFGEIIHPDGTVTPATSAVIVGGRSTLVRTAHPRDR